MRLWVNIKELWYFGHHCGWRFVLAWYLGVARWNDDDKLIGPWWAL